MATRAAAIKAVLTGSSAWTTLVTGGTFLWDDLGRNGLTPEVAEALGCYDADGKLELTAVLTMGTSGPAEVFDSERGFFRVWLYHDSSYPLIRQAVRKTKDLLERTRITVTDEGTPFIRWVDDMQEFIADELGGAMAGGSRYRIQHRRQ